MLRWIIKRAYEGNKFYGEGFCDSNDDKPTDGPITGSLLIEADTGIVTLFNEATGAWTDQFTLQEGT